MREANQYETAHKDYATVADREKIIIEELRVDPDFAELYVKTALEEINEDGGLAGFLTALRRVIEARGGISEVAKKTGLARQTISKALSRKGNPTINTLTKLLSVAGLKLTLR
ncbi:helix-turn-helix domain-containing transcriptional regulator [Enterobacter kobei]